MKEAIELIKERLEKEKSGLTTWAEDEAFKLGIEKAQKIVSEVEAEYEKDVCEWFKYDYRTIAPKYHDAENPYWRMPEDMDKLKYCPYCGKKIKVVE